MPRKGRATPCPVVALSESPMRQLLSPSRALQVSVTPTISLQDSGPVFDSLNYCDRSNSGFFWKSTTFVCKTQDFLQAVKDAERALFARIQLSRSWARYPGRPRAFFGEPHVETV